MVLCCQANPSDCGQCVLLPLRLLIWVLFSASMQLRRWSADTRPSKSYFSTRIRSARLSYKRIEVVGQKAHEARCTHRKLDAPPATFHAVAHRIEARTLIARRLLYVQESPHADVESQEVCLESSTTLSLACESSQILRLDRRNVPLWTAHPGKPGDPMPCPMLAESSLRTDPPTR